MKLNIPKNEKSSIKRYLMVFVFYIVIYFLTLLTASVERKNYPFDKAEFAAISEIFFIIIFFIFSIYGIFILLKIIKNKSINRILLILPLSEILFIIFLSPISEIIKILQLIAIIYFLYSENLLKLNKKKRSNSI